MTPESLMAVEATINELKFNRSAIVRPTHGTWDRSGRKFVQKAEEKCLEAFDRSLVHILSASGKYRTQMTMSAHLPEILEYVMVLARLWLSRCANPHQRYTSMHWFRNVTMTRSRF